MCNICSILSNCKHMIPTDYSLAVKEVLLQKLISSFFYSFMNNKKFVALEVKKNSKRFNWNIFHLSLDDYILLLTEAKRQIYIKCF